METTNSLSVPVFEVNTGFETPPVIYGPEPAPYQYHGEETYAEFRQENSPLMRRLIQASFPEVPSAFSKIADAAQSSSLAAQSITELANTIRAALSGVPSLAQYINRICDALVVLYDIVIAWIKSMFESIPSLIYRLLSLFGVTEKLIAAVILQFSLHFSPPESNQGSNDMVAQGDAPDLFSSLVSTVGLIFLSRQPDAKELKYVTEKLRFSQLMRAESNNMKDTLVSFLRALPETCQLWAQYVMPVRWWMDLFMPQGEYFRWMTEVEALQTHDIKNRAVFDLELQQHITKLHAEGLELVKKCVAGPQFSKVYALMAVKIKVIEELYSIVDMSAMYETNRPEPFSVYLVGAAGKGKTFLATVLPAILAGVPQGTPNLSFTRNPGIAHWDGYTGQFAVLYDDFYAVRNQVQPGEMAEFIAAVSNEQYRLPMASLPDKGEVFRSKVVIATSNTSYPAPNELNNPPALHRRRHAMYHVDIHPHYQRPGTTEVDRDRIPADNSHLRIQRYLNPSDPASERGPVMTYQQFIMDVKEAYRAHAISQRRSIEAARNMIANAIGENMVAEGVLLQHLQAAINRNTLGTGFAIAAVSAQMTQSMPRWYQELNEIFAEEEPSWLKAAFITVGIVSSVACSGFFLWKSFNDMQTSTNMKKAAIRATEQMHCEGKAIPKQRVAFSNALECWRNVIPDHELNKIKLAMLQRFDEMGAEGDDDFTRFMAYENALDAFKGLLSPEDIDKLKLDLRLKMKEQMGSEGAYHGVRTGAIRRPIVMRAEGRKKPDAKNMIAEGSQDPGSLEIITHGIAPAMVDIFAARKMQGIFIKGRILLCPKHAFTYVDGSQFDEGTEFHLGAVGGVFKEVYDPDRLIQLSEDLVLYRCSFNTRSWKDIIHLFITDRDLGGKDAYDALMLTSRNKQHFILKMMIEKIVNPVNVSFHPTRDGEVGKALSGGHVIKEAQGWRYEFPTMKGDCGAPIIISDKYMARKICGIHVAGSLNKDAGAALIITQEMINKGLRGIDAGPIMSDPSANFQSTLDGVALEPQGNFTYYGKLPRRLFMSDKTKIRESTIHGKIFSPVTGPSVLSPRDERLTAEVSPLRMGVEKYGNVAPVLDVKILERVSQHISSIFESWKITFPREVVSEHQAINGIPGIEFGDAMPMDTSAGYPYNQWPKTQGGKLDLFEGGPGNYTVLNALLRKNLDERWNGAMASYRTPSLWIDCLKDERRSLEKIRAGKTRVFTIPPVDFTITFRRLFLAFNINFYSNALKFFSAVGIDPESYQWTELYRRLATKSTIGFAGDYSSWDGNLSPLIMAEVCEIVNRWYDDGEEYARMRRVVFDEIIHTPQVCADLVYMTHIGNPSGNPMTAPMNTIIGAIYLRYVWLKLAPRDFASLAHYEEHVGDAIYGDDNILAVSDEARDFFTPDAVSVELKKIGMTYTAASKDGAAEWKPLRELTFLKRGFKFGERKMVLPIMDTNTIQELTNWIRESDFETPETMTIDNCKQALWFAFFHGRKYFDSLRNEIVNHLKTKAWQIPDWSYYYNRFYPSEMIAQGDAGSNNFRTQDNAKGIISQSQRAAAYDDGSKAGKAKNDRLSCQAISDPPWSLPDMVKRRSYVGVYAWSTSGNAGDIILKAEAPQEFIVSYLQSAAFERYLYWDGPMKIKIHVNGTRFHAGRLIAFFVPFVKKTYTVDWHDKSFTAAMCVPNIMLDAASSNEGVLDVPFYNPRSVMTLNGASNSDLDFTGTFVLQILSPLVAADAVATSISVNVWVEFEEDQNFRVPVHSAASGLRSFNPEHDQQRKKIANTRRLPDNFVAQGNSSSVTNNIENYGKIDDLGMPMNITGDSIGNGTELSGLPMDKPARAMNPAPMYHKAFQNLASTSGSELTTRLDLNTSNLNMSISQMYGTETDEMDMQTMFTRPTYVDTFTWASTGEGVDPGSLIASFFIGPMAHTFSNGTETAKIIPADTPSNFNLLDVLCMPFQFWRGSIKLRFDIVATQMHTGRLWLALNYGAPPEAETTLKDATSQYGVEFDLNNENRTFEYTIPWNTNMSWLNVCHGPYDSDHEYSASWFMDYFLGSWSLRVMNKLVTPTNVAPNAKIIFSIAGGDDFMVYYPSPSNETFLPVLAIYTPEPPEPEEFENMIAQGDEKMAGEDAAAVPTIVDTQEDPGTFIAPPGAKVCPPHSHFGPKAPVRHLGDFMKRYVGWLPLNPTDVDAFGHFRIAGTIGSLGVTNEQSGFTRYYAGAGTAPNYQSSSYLSFLWIPVQPFRTQAAGTFSSPAPKYTGYITDGLRSPLAYFGPMFRFWRGSIRYKCVWEGMADFKDDPLTSPAYGAVFVPGRFSFSTGRPNYAALAKKFANVLGRENGDAVVALANTNTYVTSQNSALAGDFALSMAPYNDIEIPFTTNFNVLPTENAVTNNYVNYGKLNVGHLLFFRVFHYSGDPTAMTALETNGINMIPRVLIAAGDDFRYGTFLGPPRFVSAASFKGSLAATYHQGGAMDTWPTPDFWAEAENKKRTQSDDDFVMTESVVKYLEKAKGKNALTLKFTNNMIAQGDVATTVTTPFFSELGMTLEWMGHVNHQPHRYGEACFCYTKQVGMLMHEYSTSKLDLAMVPIHIKTFLSILVITHEGLSAEKFPGIDDMAVVFDRICKIFDFNYTVSVWNDKLTPNHEVFDARVLMPPPIVPGNISKITIPFLATFHKREATIALMTIKSELLFRLFRHCQLEIMRYYKIAPFVPCPEPDCTLLPKARMLSDMLKDIQMGKEQANVAALTENMVAQGDFAETLFPSEENAHEVIVVLHADMLAHRKDPRSCINEFSQKIEQTSVTFKYESIPVNEKIRWKATLTFENKMLWGTWDESEEGANKKEASQMVSKLIMDMLMLEYGKDPVLVKKPNSPTGSMKEVREFLETKRKKQPSTGVPPGFEKEYLTHATYVSAAQPNTISENVMFPLKNIVNKSKDIWVDYRKHGYIYQYLAKNDIDWIFTVSRVVYPEYTQWMFSTDFMGVSPTFNGRVNLGTHTSYMAGQLTRARLETAMLEAFSTLFSLHAGLGGLKRQRLSAHDLEKMFDRYGPLTDQVKLESDTESSDEAE